MHFIRDEKKYVVLEAGDVAIYTESFLRNGVRCGLENRLSEFHKQDYNGYRFYSVNDVNEISALEVYYIEERYE